MIFVTVGTQPNGFLRCLQEVEKLIDRYNITEEVVAQIGNTDFATSKFKTIRFTGENEFKELIGKKYLIWERTQISRSTKHRDLPKNSTQGGPHKDT